MKLSKEIVSHYSGIIKDGRNTFLPSSAVPLAASYAIPAQWLPVLVLHAVHLSQPVHHGHAPAVHVDVPPPSLSQFELAPAQLHMQIHAPEKTHLHIHICLEWRILIVFDTQTYAY